MAEGAGKATEPQVCACREPSRTPDCSEMGPPTGVSHSQRPGLGKNNSTGRFCQNIVVYLCFALACECDDFPLTVLGTDKAWQSSGLLEQKSH